MESRTDSSTIKSMFSETADTKINQRLKEMQKIIDEIKAELLMMKQEDYINQETYKLQYNSHFQYEIIPNLCNADWHETLRKAAALRVEILRTKLQLAAIKASDDNLNKSFEKLINEFEAIAGTIPAEEYDLSFNELINQPYSPVNITIEQKGNSIEMNITCKEVGEERKIDLDDNTHPVLKKYLKMGSVIDASVLSDLLNELQSSTDYSQSLLFWYKDHNEEKPQPYNVDALATRFLKDNAKSCLIM